jgi:hypothetical protein
MFHIQHDGAVTLCGRDCSAWHRIGERDRREALSDPHICRRCARIAINRKHALDRAMGY